MIKHLSALALVMSCVACSNTPQLAAPPQNTAHSETVLAEAKGSRPNIIYIMADDLGYGDLGSYGQTKILTPHLDAMAEQGIRFTDHYAGSTVCGPSRASFYTGMHSGHSFMRGNPRWTQSGKPVELGPEQTTVATVLQNAGYRTGLIGKWGMADRRDLNLAAMPNQNGFDYFYGYKTHGAAHHYYWHELYRNNEPVILEGNDYETNTGQYTHDLFTEEALKFVNQSDEQPFFLFLAYTIPHLAVTVPEDSKKPYQNLGWPERKMNTKGHYKNDKEGHTAYAGMVSRMDRDIGRLMDLLKAKGIDDNTLVIFTSDNGHEYDKNFFDSNGDLQGKKRDLYEGGIRVPHIAKWPAKIAAKQSSDHISAFWDFMPTACDLAGTECPANDGISYLAALVGEDDKQAQHDYLYWEFNEWDGPIQAIRQGQWKLVQFKEKPAELYDLSQDVSEANNLAAQYPNRVTAMQALLREARTPHPEFVLETAPRVLKRRAK